jgi:excisionase family DNA binding protein
MTTSTATLQAASNDQPTDESCRLLRPREVADVLQVSVRSVYSLVAAGRLRACRVGIGMGTIRVHPVDLARFISDLRGTSHARPEQPRL